MLLGEGTSARSHTPASMKTITPGTPAVQSAVIVG